MSAPDVLVKFSRSFLKINLTLDAFVLGSLIFQFILLLSTPTRKRIPGIWQNIASLELMQIAIAQYIMASIPNYNSSGGRTGELRVFWVPFIILHLGGPSTLSSLALLDNELWLRFASRFFNLSYSFGLVVYRRSFLQNDLWWPTAFMFLAGALSYFEKVICNFLARLTKFRESTLPKPDAGVNYAELMEMYSSFERSAIRPEHGEISSTGVGNSADGSDDKLCEVKLVKEGYKLFQEFRGLFVNLVFSYKQRNRVRRYFLGINKAEYAFRICEVELNFAYDVFYTKAMLTYKCKYSPLLNLLSLSLQLVSLVFWIRIDKQKFQKHSVLVTNILVVGSLAHILISLLMFCTSNWCIAKVIKHEEILRAKSKLSSFYEFLLISRDRNHAGPNKGGCSRRIQQRNLLVRIIADRTVFGQFGRLDGGFRSLDGLSDFIFRELVIRSKYAEHPTHVEELCSARGMWVLDQLYREHTGFGSDTFRRWIGDVEYEESLILWHLATTLCYYTCKEKGNGQMSDLRQLSKVLSDYMFSLLIRQPDMMPPWTGISATVAIRDTSVEGRRFCDRLRISHFLRPSQLEERLTEVCGKILAVETDIVSPRQIRGDKSKAQLFEACALAKKLGELSNRWDVISRVLAEMLFYSAAHSSPSEHLDSLKNGGEFLTDVWLLMAHLGLGKQFRHKKRRDKATEIVIS